MRLLREHDATITGLRFSPDGLRLASADDTGVVRVSEAMSLEKIRSFRASKPPRSGNISRPIGDILFMTEGRELAVAHRPTSRVHGKWALDRWPIDHGGDPITIAPKLGVWVRLAPTGADQITAVHVGRPSYYYQSVTLTEFTAGIQTNTETKITRVRGRLVMDFRDGRYALGGSERPELNLTNERVYGAAWVAHPTSIRSVALPADRKLIISAGPNEIRSWDRWEGRLRYYGAEPPRPVAEWPRADGPYITTLASSPDGSTLAIGRNGGIVNLLDTDTLTEKETFRWPIGNITRLAFAPDGLRLAAGSEKGAVVIWDLE